VILWSFLGFLLIAWITKLQRDHMAERADRRERQRRQRVACAPIPGVEGNLDDEERRLLAILKERKAEGES
jgi:hypothetical protein